MAASVDHELQIAIFAARNGLTKVHPYGVPFCGWLVDTKEQHRPYNPHRTLGILINGIINVLLTDFVVRRSIRVVDIIELHTNSKDQEHLAEPRDADHGWFLVHEGQLRLRFLSVTDIEDRVLVVEKHVEKVPRDILGCERIT
jgi:hypothetical protein